MDPPWLWPRAAYVHVPFCAHHCGYCDFAIAVGRDSFIDRYLDALAAELRTLPAPQPVRTLFIGGGTPSYLSVAQLERLLTHLRNWLPLADDGEFSIEANPESLAADKIDVLADGGVTRVSLGAQSFRPPLLQALDRAHDATETARAVERTRRRIANLSLDLIFGVPGQSLADWQADLSATLALAPSHVSTYGLTFEKGTPLWKRRERGQVLPLGEDAELALYSAGIDTLAAAGFEHYEISNFALPGQRCRHNEVYWANHAYFGFGLGAARYVRGRREVNTRSLDTYLDRCLAGTTPTQESEELPPLERARETLAVQLRRSDGVNLASYHDQTGFAADAVAGPAIARHVELGLLERTREHIRLTRQGKYVADAVIAALL